MAKITKIPATKQKLSGAKIAQNKIRRTAGYARVSTDMEEQQSSYEAQLDYYQNYIKSRPDWEFVGMYSDEGVTGTSTAHREGFRSMISDALAGKIDLIITKSVSRFARNTVDSLSTIRKLKEHGTEVFFEKENIWTFDTRGELLITIMSSLAQEEARSISENTTWGIRKAFSDGVASIPYSHFLGYDKGENGEFVINEKEAETVRDIFRLFISGYSFRAICKKLEEKGAKSPTGKDKWYPSTVESIIRNEKYRGDCLLQKGYTEDFLTKKRVMNHGEVPQYYVEGHHEPIISPKTFDEAQAELTKREGSGKRWSGISVFSSKLICEECGGFYGPKVWHSTDKYRKVVWQCNNKYRGKKKRCTTPHIDEERVKSLFLEALAILYNDKEVFISNLEELRKIGEQPEDLQTKVDALSEELEGIAGKVKKLIQENAKKVMDQAEYDKKYNRLISRYEKKEQELQNVTTTLAAARAKNDAVDAFIGKLRNMDSVADEFDENLWGGMVDSVTVHKDGSVTFRFKGGATVDVG